MDAVLGWIVGADRLREDLDLRLDARTAIEIAAALDGGEEIRVPAVHRELSTARVLVMQWLTGSARATSTPSTPRP
jgi:ubiquinone biosynthesis protein